MDRETIEAILLSVSFPCREEVEAALEQPTEISAGCKKEIRIGLASYSELNIDTSNAVPIKNSPLGKLAREPEQMGVYMLFLYRFHVYASVL